MTVRRTIALVLFGLVVVAAVGLMVAGLVALAEQRGVWWAFAVFPGMPLMSAAIVAVVLQAFPRDVS